MEDKLEPIEEFITELKGESIRNKTRMTSTDETNLRYTLMIEVKNLKEGGIKEYIRALEIKLHAPGTNIFTSNGINIDSVKQIAQETSKAIKEREVRNSEDAVVHTTDNSEFQNYSNEEISNNKEKWTPSEEIKEATIKYINSEYSDADQSTKDEMYRMLVGAKGLITGYEADCKARAEAGQQPQDVETYISNNAGVFDLDPYETPLAIVMTLEEVISISGVESGQELERVINSNDCFKYVIGYDGLQNIEKHNKTYPNSTAEEMALDFGVSEETINAQKKAKGKFTFIDFIKTTSEQNRALRVINALEGNIFKLDEEIIPMQKKVVDNNEKFTEKFLERAKKQHEINLKKRAYSQRGLEIEDPISEQLREKFMIEYSKGEKTVAEIYKLFLENGEISKSDNLTSLDFVDILSDELSKQEYPSKELNEIIFNESIIAVESIKLESYEIIANNLKGKDTAIDEKNQNKKDINESNIIIRKGKESLDKSKSTNPIKKIESTEKSVENIDYDNSDFDYIGVQVKTDDFKTLLKNYNLITSDLEEERKGFISLIKESQEKVTSNRKSEDGPIQNNPDKDVSTTDDRDV